MLRAAIFDVDGLLIDSEPLWRRAEMEIFAEHGVVLTEAMCASTTGLRIDEVAAHWLGQSDPRVHEIASRIVDRMVERVREEGRAIEGGARAIELCREMGLAIALASSSPERLIAATIERLGLHDVSVTVSAERERYGKPHPAVILTTAERLGVSPTECVVFEDSVNGVLAAKSARSRCIAVPAAFERDDRRFAIADRTLTSLTEVTRPMIESLGQRAPEIRHVLTILAVDEVAPMVLFYRSAFDWPISIETPVYVELALPGGMRLGIYQRESFALNTGRAPTSIPARALAPTELYLRADDLDLAIERLRAAGAQELSPRSLRPWGDVAAYFADPAGNVVVVSQPFSEPR